MDLRIILQAMTCGYLLPSSITSQSLIVLPSITRQLAYVLFANPAYLRHRDLYAGIAVHHRKLLLIYENDH